MVLCGGRSGRAFQALAPCTAAFASPQFVPITGTLGTILIDADCQHVYVLNTTFNRIEDFSLQTMTLRPPIQVGSLPVSMDLTPDGQYLYVSNSGGNNLSVVSLPLRVETRKIIVPADSSGRDRPSSIAIANNGLALVAVSTEGSSFGTVFQLRLATDQFTPRTDVSASNRFVLKASGDRSKIGALVSSSAVVMYDAATNLFGTSRTTPSSVTGISLDQTGSTLFLTTSQRGYVLDAAFNVSGTITHNTGSRGAIHKDGLIGYRAIASRVDTIDLRTFLVTGQLPLGDTVPTSQSNYAGYMDVSADGRLVAVVTERGISIVRTAVVFTDDTLIRGVTPIRAVHVTELRQRIDAARVSKGLSEYAWTDPGLRSGFEIRPQHIIDMRAAIVEAYGEIGQSAPVFTDPVLTANMPIKIEHIMELRSAVLGLQ